MTAYNEQDKSMKQEYDLELHYRVNTAIQHADQLCKQCSNNILNYCVNNIHATR